MTHRYRNTKAYGRGSITTLKLLKRLYITILMGFLSIACDDFVEVDLPFNEITKETVFQDVNTATDVLSALYAIMNENEFTSYNLGIEMGLYADELENHRDQRPFYEHSITVLNTTVNSWWTQAYEAIYTANIVIEGVENSTAISLEDKNQLLGEALFVRAYLHSLLVQLWGSVPYITTTDYIENTTVSRTPEEMVYSLIIEDLVRASNLLSADISGERIRPYKAVAEALLARMYLYTEAWGLAEEAATNVINNFTLEPDINRVFLKDAMGTIWQFKPFTDGQNTEIAKEFVFNSQPTKVSLSDVLVEAVFEPNDLRKANWVGNFTNGNGTWYYPFKYKANGNTDTTLEYTIICRLAEQYLIRAEARAQKLVIDIAGSQSDLNIIRTRAGLPDTIANDKEELLDVILDERRVELFTEHGHRWFDLKRRNEASNVLAPIKPNWQDVRSLLLPVPESQILLNPNLLPQNSGYN